MMGVERREGFYVYKKGFEDGRKRL